MKSLPVLVMPRIYTRVLLRLATLILLLFTFMAFPATAQMLADVTATKCVQGDCENGSGTLELTTAFGKGRYVGTFQQGKFHGYGKVEVPVSNTERASYLGNWEMGVREGRGTHWNGKGNLYIGQWHNDLRHGRGTYVVNLPRWTDNLYTEYWLKENTENYSGEFVNDFYQGQGTYRWANGSKFEGGFFANDKHGPGTFYYETGTARKQVWEYGDWIR